jgi:hypothetical protein
MDYGTIKRCLNVKHLHRSERRPKRVATDWQCNVQVALRLFLTMKAVAVAYLVRRELPET